MSLEEASIVPLKDVVKRVKVGFVGSCNDDYCSPEVGVPMIRTTNLTKEGIKLENLKYINNKFHVSHIKSQLNFGDILIARHGHNGLASLWEYKFDAQCLNVVVVEPNESLADKYYLTYLINSPLIQQQIKSLTGGSVQSVVNTKDIADLLIPVPPLSKQKEIANFILLFNKKIAINKSINKNLEEQLSLLFNDWFVNCTPFKNEELIKSEWDVVPESWKDIEFGELIEITSGNRPDEKSEDKTSEFNIPLFGASKIMGYTKEYSYNEDILIIGRVGTHGVVQRVNYPCFPSDNTFVIKSDYYGFVYQLLKRIDYDSLNTGSTQPLITQKSLKSVNTILPDEKILSKFEMISKTIFDKIQLNNDEISKLTKLRDTLLPKLMSGEIDVSKINCDLKIIIRKIYIKSSKLFLWRYLSENQNHIKNTKSNETLLKSRAIHKINKFLAKFNARYRHYRQ